ncbi:hypothetical protein GBA52_026854 [Prunus armeniaca]|nr:hypothetical protein GBA52_026854 [Prunus armeniaca]
MLTSSRTQPPTNLRYAKPRWLGRQSPNDKMGREGERREEEEGERQRVGLRGLEALAEGERRWILLSGTKLRSQCIRVSKIPYYTHWGQSLLVRGSEPVLGSWNLKKGLLLSPVHHVDKLIGFGIVPVPKGFKCEYIYYVVDFLFFLAEHVVDDNRNVVRWEMARET